MNAKMTKFVNGIKLHLIRQPKHPCRYIHPGDILVFCFIPRESFQVPHKVKADSARQRLFVVIQIV